MDYPIIRDGPVNPDEINDLRAAVGWDRCDGTYEQTLGRHYARYTVRAEDGLLVGFLSVLSDGVSDAFLLDLMVHPQHQGRSIGRCLVETAVRDAREAGIRCVQVTFNKELSGFYARCGFHLFGGGIIDFKHMPPDAEDNSA